MVSRKPTLGYRSRTDAVVALRAGGLSTKEIARQLEVSYNTVTSLECQRRHSKGNRTVLLPVDTLERLKTPANQRNITANELVRRIVEVIIDDDMIDAVLDDSAALTTAVEGAS
jgi:orotate phosphoribosyltransferase-like protein